MSDIFDEENMSRALEKYVPEGETLIAGIHAVAKEIERDLLFENCILEEDRLIPAGESGQDILVIKKKYASCDIYLGITQTALVFTECEKERWYYEFVDAERAIEAHKDGAELASEILLSDIGKCVSLSSIRGFEIKNGMFGSKKCNITLIGGHLKLLFPKLGGVGGGMPHYSEYKEKIIARLSEIAK